MNTLEILNKAIIDFEQIGGKPYAIILPYGFKLGIENELLIKTYKGLIVYSAKSLVSNFDIVSKQDFERIKKFEEEE